MLQYFIFSDSGSQDKQLSQVVSLTALLVTAAALL